MKTLLDPVELARELIRRPSVTPADAGAMDVLQGALQGLHFEVRRLRFGEIENLYARHGSKGPNLCFAGHTDVVPVGNTAGWRTDPFAATVEDGLLIGRGAVDMKGAIAAFAAAASRAIAAGTVTGSLSFLITGDEEGRRSTAPARSSKPCWPKAKWSTTACLASRPAHRGSATV